MSSVAASSATSRCRAERDGGPEAIAIPGTHQRIMPFVRKHVPVENAPRMLDLGAGEGEFSRQLVQAGYQVDACDMFPDMFKCPGVECRQADAHQPLPYEDGTFDAVVMIEVVEHLESHLALFQEINRILKPGGKFIFSTPNIMSLKSRLRFLTTGYLYSHGPLDPDVYDPVIQHIAPFTPDRYRFVLGRAGLEMYDVGADKFQKSSLWLSWLVPFVRLSTKLKLTRTPGTEMQNCRASLFGRTLITAARKPASPNGSS